MARYSNSIWRPTDKFGYGSIVRHTNGVKRVIIHSAEGYRAGMFGVLDGPRQASWHFSPMRNGEVYQHISTGNIAWGGGSFEANDGSIHIEEEGVAGEELTPAQYSSTITLLIWIFQGYRLGTPSRETNLREHNEFTDTNCPSGRILWARLIEDLPEDEMNEAEVREIASQEAKFWIGVNLDNQEGFNQHQMDVIKQVIRSLANEGRTLEDIAAGLKVVPQ